MHHYHLYTGASSASSFAAGFLACEALRLARDGLVGPTAFACVCALALLFLAWILHASALLVRAKRVYLDGLDRIVGIEIEVQETDDDRDR